LGILGNLICWKNPVVRVKIIPYLFNCTCTWKVTCTPALLPLLEWQVILNGVSPASKVFDLLKIGVNHSQLALRPGSTRPSFCPTGLRCCRVFLQERGSSFIWLLRDSTGVLASRQTGYRHRCGRNGDGGCCCCLWLPASLWWGLGVKWRHWRKTYRISSGWLMGSHSCRQAIWILTISKKSNMHANILTFDLNISQGSHTFHATLPFSLLSNWSLKTSGRDSIHAQLTLNSGSYNKTVSWPKQKY